MIPYPIRDKQTPVTPEMQAYARRYLMNNALSFCRMGYPSNNWKHKKFIESVVTDFELPPEILDHICEYIWNHHLSMSTNK